MKQIYSANGDIDKIVKAAKADPSKAYRDFLQNASRYSKENQAMAWGVIGQFLAKKLDCDVKIVARSSSSNYNLMLDLIKICETNDMKNSCVGIQLTERTRREVWISDRKIYNTFNFSTLSLNDESF